MKKNVVVVLCDQLRADFLSCYQEASPAHTPHIDALAQDGLLCRHAVTASPVCAPGRACMMTGRYVSDHGVWTNDVPFREGLEYFPRRMQENGYRCGAFGKLHHFPAKDSKGFDVVFQMEENRLGWEDDYLKWLAERHPQNPVLFPMDGNGRFPYSPEEYYEYRIAEEAIHFMRGCKEAPFLAWVSFQGPHTPIDPPYVEYTAEDSEPKSPDFSPPCEVPAYRKSRGNAFSWKEQCDYRKGYAQLVEFIDGQVGRLISFLKETGQYENTLILFSSDHGDLCGDYSMRQKGPFPYAAQLEIPLIVTNHPCLPKGEETDLLTGNLDLAATALSFAGDPRPLAYSRDLAAMYRDPSIRRSVIYSEFCDSMKVVSTQKYRLAYYPFTGQCEMFEIGRETVNLAEQPEFQSVKAEMLMHLIDFQVLAHGVRIEAQDLTPRVQAGLGEKWPGYQGEIPLAFPIAQEQERERLRRDGLDADYNEFCREHPILRSYGTYWESLT